MCGNSMILRKLAGRQGSVEGDQCQRNQARSAGVAGRHLVGPSRVGKWEQEMEFQRGKDTNAALEGERRVSWVMWRLTWVGEVSTWQGYILLSLLSAYTPVLLLLLFFSRILAALGLPCCTQAFF